MSKDKITTVVLNWNGMQDTLECLSSLQKAPHFQTIVVDNGSSDNSCQAISSAFPNVILIQTGKNLGYAEGNNVGIRRALNEGADWIFLLNNDTVVDPEIFTRFLEEKDAEILGACPFLYSRPDRIDHIGGIWDAKKGTFALVGKEKKREEISSFDVDYVTGCGILIKRSVFETIGLLDARFFLFWEEADFCFRAKHSGFKVKSCREAKLWHKVSASFTGGKPHIAYFWWRNRLLWIEKNSPPKEKIFLFYKILFREFFHQYKLQLLKGLQYSLIHRFKNDRWKSEKEGKLRQYRSSVQGVKDYLLRKFGNGPAWIYGPSKFRQ